MNKFGIILFSVVETAALVAWLALNRLGVSLYSISLLSTAILIVGLSLEHIISYNVAHELPLLSFRNKPLSKIIGFSVSETVLWVLWLYILTLFSNVLGGLFFATFFLLLTFIFQHNVEFNAIEGRPLFFNLTNPKSVGISLVESIGAGIWFYLANPVETTFSVAGAIAAAVLLITMIVEHFIQASKVELVKV